MVLALTADAVTVNVMSAVPASPSARLWSSIESVGAGSSSAIVTTPWPSAIVALDAPERFTTNVSSTSSSPSPRTGTEIDFAACPGVNVRVPDDVV